MNEAQGVSRRGGLQAVDAVILALPAAIFVAVTIGLLWTHPSPTDPINYLRPTLWRDMSVVTYPDRLMVSLDMYFSNLISRPFLDDPALRMGAFHSMLINTLCVLIGAAYCYLRAGFAAGLTYSVFLSTSYVYLRYSNEAYPDIDMSQHTLLAGAFLMAGYRRNVLISSTTLAGAFTVFVAISKPTSLATVAVVTVFLFTRRRDWRSFLLGLLLGAVAAAGICLLAFDFDSIVRFATDLRSQMNYAIRSMTFGREGIDVSVYDAIVQQRYFPLLVGLFVLAAFWRDPEVRFWFVLGLAHLVLLSAIIGLSQTIRSDNAIYYHTACTCACVGLSLGLGRTLFEWDQKRGVVGQPAYNVASRAGGVLLVLLILVSFWFTVKGGRYADAPAADETPGWFRSVYAIVPMLLLALLLMLGAFRAVPAAFLLLIGVTLWQPFLALNETLPHYRRTQWLRATMHVGASHFNDVEEGPIGVLIDRFGRHSDRYVDGMHREYACYFDDGRFTGAPRSGRYARIRAAIQALSDPSAASRVRYVIVDSDGYRRVQKAGTPVEPVSQWQCAGDTFRLLKVVQQESAAP